jgi:antitoxin HigA-1
VNLIVNGRRSITADTAMRLAHYFGTSAQMWKILQTAYDLEVAQTKAAAIKREVIPGFRVA